MRSVQRNALGPLGGGALAVRRAGSVGELVAAASDAATGDGLGPGGAGSAEQPATSAIATDAPRMERRVTSRFSRLPRHEEQLVPRRREKTRALPPASFVR